MLNPPRVLRPFSRRKKFIHPLFIEDTSPRSRSKGLVYWLKRGLLCLLFVVVAGWSIERANAEPVELTRLEQVAAGQLLLEGLDGQQTQSLLLDSQVHFSVSGMTAEVTFKQSFKNDSADWVEGIYAFPLPDKAAVRHMRMLIGERVIEGEIKEKSVAKKIYKAAKREGKKASLVSQQRPNMFTSRVANIAPGETVSVELQYIERVAYDTGQFSLRFPMTITPRYIPGRTLAAGERSEQPLMLDPAHGWAMNTDQVPDASEITPYMNPLVASDTVLINPIAVTATVDMGMALQALESAYHDITLSRKQHRYSVRLTQSKVSMTQDFVLHWQPQLGREPHAALFSESLEGEDYGLLMLVPPQAATVAEKATTQPKEAIYLVDTSGSMGGVSIRQARESLLYGLQQLQPSDRFNIIAFNSVTDSLFSAAVFATADNLLQAQRYVSGLEAGGGTEMLPAIKLALSAQAQGETLETHIRQVLFITDGAIGNEDALLATIHGQLGSSRLFTVGIGSAPNTHFMRKAAQFGRGSFTHIGNVDEVQEKMTALFNKIKQPLVTDIRITWPSAQPVEQLPSRIKDLYAGEPLVVTAKLAALKGDILIGGRFAGKPWQQKIKAGGVSQHGGIASVWAREKIADLLDEKISGRDASAVRLDVLDVALRHHLLSPYTSFVAVEKVVSREPERLLKAQLKAKRVLNARPQGQAPQTFAYPKTATGAKASILWGLALLLLVWVIARSLRKEEDYELVK